MSLQPRDMGFSDMSDFETGSALTMSDDEDPTYPTLCLSMSPDPTRSTDLHVLVETWMIWMLSQF